VSLQVASGGERVESRFQQVSTGTQRPDKEYLPMDGEQMVAARFLLISASAFRCQNNKHMHGPTVDIYVLMAIILMSEQESHNIHFRYFVQSPIRR
jgi:hypothetical protein